MQHTQLPQWKSVLITTQLIYYIMNAFGASIIQVTMQINVEAIRSNIKLMHFIIKGYIKLWKIDKNK